MADQIQRFTFAQLPVRGEIITLENSFKTICDQHQYSAAVRHLLGEALAATALMADTIKIEGKVALQLQSSAQVKLLLTECDHHGHIRGVLHTQDAALERYDFKEWTQSGTLAITIEPEKGHRYQGIVSLAHDSLAKCIEHYFTSSEQLPTYLKLFVNEERVTGLFLQAMPDEKGNKEAFEHVTMLAETLTEEEALVLEHQDLLYRLYHEDEVSLFSPKNLQFKCSCSRERNERALLTLEPKELMELVQDNGGQLEMVCDFCSHREVFSEQQIVELITTDSGTSSVN